MLSDRIARIATWPIRVVRRRRRRAEPEWSLEGTRRIAEAYESMGLPWCAVCSYAEFGARHGVKDWRPREHECPRGNPHGAAADANKGASR